MKCITRFHKEGVFGMVKETKYSVHTQFFTMGKTTKKQRKKNPGDVLGGPSTEDIKIAEEEVVKLEEDSNTNTLANNIFNAQYGGKGSDFHDDHDNFS